MTSRAGRGRRLLLVGALTGLGSAGLGIAAVIGGIGPDQPSGQADQAERAAADPTGLRLVSTPPRVPGVPTLPPPEPSQPNLVRRGGATLVCPGGMEPVMQVQGATFDPPLAAGTTFEARRYRVSVRGRVANESTEPIEVRSVTVTISGRPWRSTGTVTTIPAGEVAPVTFDGVFVSPARQQAVVNSTVQWQWQAPGLRPCGDEGLVEDD